MSVCLVAQSCPTVCDHVPVPRQAPLYMGILEARMLEWVAMPSSRGSSKPKDQTQISHIAGRFFTFWPTGKPKNTGVGRLSLLQEIFLTQESNWGLLYWRWILCQLSYQRSPGSIANPCQYSQWQSLKLEIRLYRSEWVLDLESVQSANPAFETHKTSDFGQVFEAIGPHLQN